MDGALPPLLLFSSALASAVEGTVPPMTTGSSSSAKRHFHVVSSSQPAEAMSPQRKSARARTDSMKGAALIEATSPRPPLSNKERIDAYRNRDTLERKRPTASHAKAQRAYRERCRARTPPPPPVCAYRGKTCLEIEKDLRRGHLPLPLDLLGPPGRLCDVCRKKKDALVCRRRCGSCTAVDDGRLPAYRCKCSPNGGEGEAISCVERLLSSNPRENMRLSHPRARRLCPVCRPRLEIATSFPNPPLSSEAELALATKMSQCFCGKFKPHPENPNQCISGQSSNYAGIGCNRMRTDFNKRAENALQRLTATRAQMPSDHVGAESRPPEPPSASIEAPIAHAPAPASSEPSEVHLEFADSARQGGGGTNNSMSAPASSRHAALPQSSSASSHVGKSSAAVAANDSSAAGAAVSGGHKLPEVPWWFEPCFNFEHEASDTDPTKCKCGRDLTVAGIRVRNAFRAPKECANPKCQISWPASTRPNGQLILGPCLKCGKVYHCVQYQDAFFSPCISDHHAAHAPNCFVAKCTANLNDLS
jgi:hypothetical protein